MTHLGKFISILFIAAGLFAILGVFDWTENRVIQLVVISLGVGAMAIGVANILFLRKNRWPSEPE